MNEEEYKEYLKKIIDSFCGEKYVKSVKSSFFEPEVKLVHKDDYNDYKYFYYKVGLFDGEINQVRITTHENDLYRSYCNCYTFYKDGMCTHIASALIYDIENIVPRPLTKEELSKKILDEYKSKKRSAIKNRLKVEVELSLGDEPYFKLHIGEDKTYVLNTERKLSDFLEAYNNKPYKFGKNFTYYPSKHYLDKEDEELIYFLTSNFDNHMMNLNQRELYGLFDKLNTKGFTLTNYGRINKIKKGIPKIFELDKEDKYKLKLKLDKVFFPKKSSEFIAYNNELYISNREDGKLLADMINNKLNEIEFDSEDLDLFKNGLLKTIKRSVKSNIEEIKIAEKPDAKIYIDFDDEGIKANVKFDYLDEEIDYFDKNTSVLRDEEEEDKIISMLYNNGFIKTKKDFELLDIDKIGMFLEEGINLLNKNVEVFTSKKFDDVSLKKKSSVKSMFSIGEDNILSYKFSIDNINMNEIDSLLNSLRIKKKYFKLKSGDILKLDGNEGIEDFKNLIDDLSIKKINNEEIKIPKYRAFYIDSLKESKYKHIETDNSFDTFISNFKKYKDIDICFSNDDNKLLRDYQKVGVKWLWSLYKCDLGGILADEMGLGKSLQTICFIKEILKEKNDAKVLIVCPTSLVYNWKKEFDKFAPDLKYVTVSESKQKRVEVINRFNDYNIFITSYGLIRNDNDEYEDKEFELCVIDEAQAIKNYEALMTKEIKKIKAKTKIALTGTPIENSIYELWSIFDFIMPGYLNSISKFREIYGIKDVDEESLKVLEKLEYQIRPFILRRKKKDVIKDLPDKIENNIYLELPDKQKSLYLSVLKDVKEEIEEMQNNGEQSKVRFKLLTLLTRLRQICINPYVVFEKYDGEAIKMEKLLDIVKDLKSENHKVLIFSSFKTVIDKVKDMFDEEDISSYVISGEVKSKDRVELVDKFNTDDTTAFLITLKSGGTGLNLTGADNVIHLDIWWNPQAENQATDRSHRIGQTKNVTVTRLITKGTIEERIIELQEKKKILSDNLIEGKEKSIINNLTEEEIKELLSFSDN